MAIAAPRERSDEGQRRDETRKEKRADVSNFRDVGPDGGSTEAVVRRVARAHCRIPEGAPKEVSDMSNRFHTRLLSLASKNGSASRCRAGW